MSVIESEAEEGNGRRDRFPQLLEEFQKKKSMFNVHAHRTNAPTVENLICIGALCGVKYMSVRSYGVWDAFIEGTAMRGGRSTFKSAGTRQYTEED